MATVHEQVRNNRHSRSTSRFGVNARDRRVVISHTHVLQDNDDLTQGAMNPWRTQTLFHLLPQRWRTSAYRSIFFRSRFVVHHSLQECDSSFRGGPTVSQSVLSQTGSRGKSVKYRGSGGWVKRNFSSFRSLYQNGNGTRTSSQESTQQIHKSIRCECEIEELSFRTHMCYKTIVGYGSPLLMGTTCRNQQDSCR